MKNKNEMMIVTLLNKKIEENQDFLDKFNDNSSHSLDKDFVDSLKKNINFITEVSIEKIRDVMDLLEYKDDLERSEIEEYLLMIRKMLVSNKERHTTYRIHDSQMKYVELLFEKIDSYFVSLEENKEKKKIEYEAIKTKNSKYRELLENLLDKNNNDFIIEIDIISELFNDCEIDEIKKRAILVEIINYNKEIFKRKSESDVIEVQLEKIKVEDAVSLFNEFGYDFNLLKEDDRNTILKYGSISRMREVFQTLKDNEFPRFIEKRDGKRMVSMLIRSNRKTIEDVLKYAKEYNLSQGELLSIAAVLISQKTSKNTKDGSKRKNSEPGNGEKVRNNPDEADDLDSEIINGRSEDFKKNCDFLDSIGLSPKYVFQKCRGLLVFNHDKLVSNYEVFKAYGFTFEGNMGGEVVHPALSCLLSNNLAEIADMFIEIMPLGHEYIKYNLSRLVSISSPDDLIFYNIYSSLQDIDVYGREIEPEGPFYGNPENLMLSGKITRYAGSKFRDVPYNGITSENKREKTNTIEIKCKNKYTFDEAVSMNEEPFSVNINDISDPRIARLEEYVDPNNPIRYKFGNVLISKMKVLRILDILKQNNLDSLEDSLIYAITYNSIITQNDYDMIKQLIDEKEKRI